MKANVVFFPLPRTVSSDTSIPWLDELGRGSCGALPEEEISRAEVAGCVARQIEVALL